MESKRQLIYFRNYFWDFFNDQTEKEKIKKTQKTPKKEIEKALEIKAEYFEYKKR